MKNLTTLLKQTKLLEDLPLDVMERFILPNGRCSSYTKGSYLIYEQDKVDTVKILLSGKVNIFYYFADGSYSLAGTETPPRIVALDLIATRTQLAPYCAVAAENSTLFSFPANVILQPGSLPETERQLLLGRLLSMLSNLNMQKEKHIMILSRSGLRDRIITYLSMQALWRQRTSFTIPFSREEMAAYLCVNRSALSHELSLMKREGLIDFHKNQFVLHRIASQRP